eukprot:1155879-Pelagomonas_calceolata.AAC.9
MTSFMRRHQLTCMHAAPRVLPWAFTVGQPWSHAPPPHSSFLHASMPPFLHAPPHILQHRTRPCLLLDSTQSASPVVSGRFQQQQQQQQAAGGAHSNQKFSLR